MLKRHSAGRAYARRGVAGLCLVLGGCAGTDAHAVLRAGYGAVLATQDRDGDLALDRGEVTAMVDRAFPPERRGKGWETLRAWLIAAYMEQDADGDGRLTLGELLNDGAEGCADPGGDGAPSPSELIASIGRCPAGMLPADDAPEMARPGSAE